MMIRNKLMISFTVPMKINSEKKHSVRYDAVDKEAGVQSIYVMRDSLPSNIPQNIVVKVEYALENE
jgi:hypothetical protein